MVKHKTDNPTTQGIKPKNIKNRQILSSIIVILLCYACFFSTPYLIVDGNEYLLTPVGKQNEIANNRFVTINSWQYSAKQKTMEIELGLSNLNYDGFNTYSFTAKSRSITGINPLEVTPVIEKNDLYVVQLEDIPQNFNEILLKVSIEGDKYDGVSLSLYTNKKSVESVDSITKKTEYEYRIQSIERRIEQYKAEIENSKTLISEATTRIQNINQEILEMEESKKYLTAAEIKTMNQTISSKETLIRNEEIAIETLKSDITEYEAKIEKSKQEIADLGEG